VQPCVLPALSVAGARIAHLAPFPLPAPSNRPGGSPAAGSPAGFSPGTRALAPFARRNSSFCSLRTLVGVGRPRGQSPGARLPPQRNRSQAPSLDRRYLASSVLRVCPPPQTARPVPRGESGWELDPPVPGLPVLRPTSVYRHTVAITPVGPRQGLIRA
jgi:hypothetical protein